MASQPELRYLGFSSFEIRSDNLRLLLDPWIREPPWGNWELDDFADVDYIFVTHGAYDHLGDTLELAGTSGAQVVTEPAVASHLREAGLPESQVVKVIWGNEFEVEGDLRIKVLETRHLSFFSSHHGHKSGMPLSFIFEFFNGSRSVYAMGDTSLFSDLQFFIDRYMPDLLLLPIGAAPDDRAPLPPEDAGVVSAWASEKTIIPVHYVPGSPEVSKYIDAVDRECDKSHPEIQWMEVGDTAKL